MENQLWDFSVRLGNKTGSSNQASTDAFSTTQRSSQEEEKLPTPFLEVWHISGQCFFKPLLPLKVVELL